MDRDKDDNICWCKIYCELSGITLQEFIYSSDEMSFDYEQFLIENKLDNNENSMLEFLSIYDKEI